MIWKKTYEKAVAKEVEIEMSWNYNTSRNNM